MFIKIKNYFFNEDKYVLFIYLFIFITPWNLFNFQMVVLSSILLIWGVYKYKAFFFEKLKIIFEFRPLLLWVSFVLFSYIAIFWSESFVDGFKRVNNFHKYEFIFIPALLLSLNKDGAIVAIKLLIASFSLYSLFSIFIYLDFISIAGSSVYNPKGILRFSISTQYMTIASFSSMLFALYSNIKYEKYIFVMLSILSAFALYINYSRTSQLAFLIILTIFMTIFLIRYAKNFKFYISTIVITLCVLFAFINNDKMMHKFDNAIGEVSYAYKHNSYQGSFGARLYFNKAGIEILSENPFFGLGPVDNRNKLVDMEKVDKSYHVRVIDHFHSEHMEILTAYGLVGYFLIFSSIIMLVFKLQPYSLERYLAMSVFLTLFFVSFANKTLALKPINYVYVIFIVLFSIIAYHHQFKKDDQEERS